MDGSPLHLVAIELILSPLVIHIDCAIRMKLYLFLPSNDLKIVVLTLSI